MRMMATVKEGAVTMESDVVVSLPVTEDADTKTAALDTQPVLPSRLEDLQARKRSRLFNYLNGPYIQHQLLVVCVQELRSLNGTGGHIKGRIFHIAPYTTDYIGTVFSQLLWFLNICLPLVFILLGLMCYDTWLVCCCSIGLSVLVSLHSVTIFIILHNQKISRRTWFINKVDLEHDGGRENSVVEVCADGAMTLPSLNASQKSQVIRQVAMLPDKKGMVMICTRSFWTSRVLDPLICCLILVILSLVALVVCVDLIRQNHL